MVKDERPKSYEWWVVKNENPPPRGRLQSVILQANGCLVDNPAARCPHQSVRQLPEIIGETQSDAPEA